MCVSTCTYRGDIPEYPTRARLEAHASLPCQTLSGPLPQSGSPAREARGAAAAAPQREIGPQRQAISPSEDGKQISSVKTCFTKSIAYNFQKDLQIKSKSVKEAGRYEL